MSEFPYIQEIVEHLSVERKKRLDNAIFGEIKEIIKDNSLDTVIVLDEKAIVKALEKQIPKKPIITIDGFFNGQPIYDTWGCPNCGKVNETDFEDYEYCPICGQALDWSDTE